MAQIFNNGQPTVNGGYGEELSESDSYGKVGSESQPLALVTDLLAGCTVWLHRLTSGAHDLLSLAGLEATTIII